MKLTRQQVPTKPKQPDGPVLPQEKADVWHQRDWLMPEFAQGDMCIGFFKEMYAAGRLPLFPHGGKVLEVGCAEVDWLTPMKAERPDLHLTGVDQRRIDKKPLRDSARPGADVLMLGDIMNAGLFPPATFDVVVAISVIEHVGIGRYNDPKAEDGDTRAMANIHRWLKPDGFLYMDVPYRPEGPSTPFRQYNEADLQARVIQGWTCVDRQFFEANHPDAPYMALVLRP